MGKRRVKKTVKQAASSPGGDLNGVEAKEPQIGKQGAQSTDPDGMSLLRHAYCDCRIIYL